MAEASEKKRQQLREAFGIREDYVEGSAFNFGQQNQQQDKDKEKCVLIMLILYGGTKLIHKVSYYASIGRVLFCVP